MKVQKTSLCNTTTLVINCGVFIDPINGIPKVIGTTTNLLWHAAEFDTKKFVYISSSMVYGDFVDGTREESNTKPQNIYGEAKLTGERLTKLLHA